MDVVAERRLLEQIKQWQGIETDVMLEPVVSIKVDRLLEPSKQIRNQRAQQTEV